MSERIHEPKPRILVVDDDANNRALMRFYLREFTSDIVEAETGMDAVRLVEADAFDLVLLDVMMPGMDGFAATRRIRQVRRNDGLPIVLVTAFGHREARIQALESGADEYLEKPFVAREFRARVDNLLRVRSHARHHAARTAELETLSAFKEEMSALVVHDLKSPLASLTTNLSVVQSVLARGDGPNPVLDALADCQSSATTLRRRIGNLLDIARCESGALIASRTPVSVASLVRPVVHQREAEVDALRLHLELVLDSDAEVHVDRELVSRIFENLFDNAVKFTPAEGRIRIVATTGDGRFQLCVANDGSAIPRDQRARIFEKFASGARSGMRSSHGLGLYFCKLATAAHGGTLSLAEMPPFSTAFSLSIPSHAA